MLGWPRCLKVVLTTLGGLLAAAYGSIVLMNPYGHLPVRVFGAHVIMDINQRFQYPAIVRSRAFDSVVIGTSTGRLLDPHRLDAKLGGRFANLGMNDARAWEQYQLARLFLANEPRPKTLLMALDLVWCDASADVNRITARGFPEWLYDDTPWNDWHYLLNPRTLEFAGRLALHRLGIKPPRIPANGFEIFVPPEADYDAAKAHSNLWDGRSQHRVPVSPAYIPSAADMREWSLSLPAMVWLDELLATPPASTLRLLVFVPTHVGNQPIAGSRDAAQEHACKAEVEKIGRRYGALTIDFRIASDITTRDTNFWDPLHYRLPIADRVIDGIAEAALAARVDPAGDWSFITSSMRRGDKRD